SLSAVIGKNIQDLKIDNTIFSCCKKYIQEGSTFTREITLKDIVCLISSFETITPDGEDVRIYIIKDVTELRRLKEQLYHADKLASIGQLVSGVAHELNNPLTGILGYTELLKMKVKDDSITKELDKIYKAAERCKKIVENLLTFSRQKPPERTYVDINDLIDSAIELRIYWFRSNNIEVIRDFAELPAVYVDPQQLQQVFMNLIVNAEYAVMESNKAQKMIKIKTYKREDQDKIRIEVQDNGIGIPEDQIGRIFDPFFTTKPVDKGSGLGLSISHGIIKEHNGEIWVESTPGEGTTFYIELPIK
ncbi:MAG: GHKL domain-containing protein, partial [Nitrospirae bacterium]|nr:GHKL domain-containing protein [Nitrospirota bacterium]